MAYSRVGLEKLRDFLPEGGYEWILPYVRRYVIDLKITTERQSKLGDYIFKIKENRHKISINGTLNKYEFFFTFIHELAHLITFVAYRYTVDAHGIEWKANFQQLLRTAIELFPQELQIHIEQHLKSTKSSQCFDTKLYLAFKSYDDKPRTYIKDIKEGGLFRIAKGDTFKLLHKRRTRYLCEHVVNMKQYLFPELYEVTPLP